MIKVTILNAEADQKVRQAFALSLSQLSHEPNIELNIQPYPLAGSNLRQTFLEGVEQADFIISLISIDFLVAEEGFFLQLVQRAHNQMNKKVIPILIRATSNWQNIAPFSTIVPLLNNQKPLVIKKEEQVQINESRLTDIIASIRQLIIGVPITDKLVQAVPKKITTLSGQRRWLISIGILATFFIPTSILWAFTPIYEHFNNKLFFFFPFILMSLVLFFFLRPLDSPKTQNKIIGVTIVVFIIYSLFFQYYCFESDHHGGYITTGLQFQEEVLESGKQQQTPQNLILHYGLRRFIWKHTYIVESILLLMNITLKILLGMAVYILIQRYWGYLFYQKLVNP